MSILGGECGVRLPLYVSENDPLSNLRCLRLSFVIEGVSRFHRLLLPNDGRSYQKTCSLTVDLFSFWVFITSSSGSWCTDGVRAAGFLASESREEAEAESDAKSGTDSDSFDSRGSAVFSGGSINHPKKSQRLEGSGVWQITWLRM